MSDIITMANEKAKMSVEKIDSEKVTFMHLVEATVVENDEQLEVAVDTMKQIKSRIKWLEEDRKSITGPINQALKAINSKYKPASDFLKTIVTKLDSKVTPYMVAKQAAEIKAQRDAQQAEFDRKAKEAEEMARIAKEQSSEMAKEFADKAEEEALAVASKDIDVSKTARTSTGATNTLRSRWVCEVIDAAAVPREYCEPANKLLSEAVKNGVREIKGCVIKEVFSSATR